LFLLRALAVGVELLRELPNPLLLLFGAVGKRERIEAAGFDVYRIIAEAEPTTTSKSINGVEAAAEYAEMEGIIEGEHDQFVVGQDRGIEELENTMFGRFDRRDVPGKIGKCRAQLSSGPTEKPPVILDVRFPVLISLGLNRCQNMLIYSRESFTHLFSCESKEVDHHHTARLVCEVAPVAVGADVFFKPFHFAKPERLRFLGSDDKTRNREASCLERTIPRLL